MRGGWLREGGSAFMAVWSQRVREDMIGTPRAVRDGGRGEALLERCGTV